MEFRRQKYIKDMMDARKDGFIKVITGLRRVGKSYVLFNLFRRHMLEAGFPEDHIISVEFDRKDNSHLRSSDLLYSYIKSEMTDDGEYLVLLDEIQLVQGFEEVLNSLLHFDNVDVYVTGSNSRFLSSDIVTEFRGRSHEIRIHPLSFSEFVENYEGDKGNAWNEYYTYGGMPTVVLAKDYRRKAAILRDLYELVYLNDITARYRINNPDNLSELISVLASSEGSLVSSTKLADTFNSVKHSRLSDDTVNTYIGYLRDAFLINEVERYDIKGRKKIGAQRKYYFEDPGLRNVRLSFNQIEVNHIMEAIVYSELLYRDMIVNVGVVGMEYTNNDGSRSKKQLEVDFLANNLLSQRYYIQCTLSVKDREKREQEERPFRYIRDSFRKLIVVEDKIIPFHDEMGTLVIGIEDFLLDPESLNR